MKNPFLPFLLITFLLTSCSSEPEVITPLSNDCVLANKLPLVVDELDQVLHPFSSSVPNAPAEELAALDDYFAQVKVVGLGEATHGTLEFFEMKHRIFKYLVEEHGYRAMIFEANFANTLAVNNYVVDGIGEIDAVVDKMRFWTWDTDEVKALIEWMHVYNLNKPADEKIFFYGADCQYQTDEIAFVLDYLSQVDPNYQAIADSLYTPFKNHNYNYKEESDSIKMEIQQNVNQVITHLEAKRTDYIALSTAKTYELILQTTKVIAQVEEVLSGRTSGARDKYMGKNTLWWRNYIGDDAKVAFWAHNMHVITHDWSFKTAGVQIKDLIGDEFMNIAFSFSTGTFNAIGNSGRLSTHTIRIPLCNSINFIFQNANTDRFYLIMDEVNNFQILDEWLNDNQDFLNIGSTFRGNNSSVYYYPMNIKAFFDVVIHFDETRASVF